MARITKLIFPLRLLFFGFTLTFFFGCNKDNDNAEPEPEPEPLIVTINADTTYQTISG